MYIYIYVYIIYIYIYIYIIWHEKHNVRSANYCSHPSIEERQRRKKGKLTCSSTLHSVWSVYSSKGSRLYLRVPLNRTGSCRYTHHISHTLLTATPQHTPHQPHIPHCYTVLTPQHCSPDHHKPLRGSNANIQYLGYDGDVATEVM